MYEPLTMQMTITTPLLSPSVQITMGNPAEHTKKENLSKCEIKVLFTEVKARKNVLFCCLYSGIGNKCKLAEWQTVTMAMSMFSAQRHIQWLKKYKKGSDVKVDFKRRVSRVSPPQVGAQASRSWCHMKEGSLQLSEKPSYLTFSCEGGNKTIHLSVSHVTVQCMPNKQAEQTELHSVKPFTVTDCNVEAGESGSRDTSPPVHHNCTVPDDRPLHWPSWFGTPGKARHLWEISFNRFSLRSISQTCLKWGGGRIKLSWQCWGFRDGCLYLFPKWLFHSTPSYFRQVMKGGNSSIFLQCWENCKLEMTVPARFWPFWCFTLST